MTWCHSLASCVGMSAPSWPFSLLTLHIAAYTNMANLQQRHHASDCNIACRVVLLHVCTAYLVFPPNAQQLHVTLAAFTHVMQPELHTCCQASLCLLASSMLLLCCACNLASTITSHHVCRQTLCPFSLILSDEIKQISRPSPLPPVLLLHPEA